MDQELNIESQGIREWPKEVYDYHRNEATDYLVIKEILAAIPIEQGQALVDYGCGLGRVIFTCHYLYQIPVRGIELHPATFEELAENLNSYRQAHNASEDELQIFHAYAQDYQIKPRDTYFYFFNPFSVSIMKQVIFEIIEASKRVDLPKYLILYYPERALIDFVDALPTLTLYQVMKFDMNDPRDVCYIYQVTKEFYHDTY